MANIYCNEIDMRLNWESHIKNNGLCTDSHTANNVYNNNVSSQNQIKCLIIQAFQTITELRPRKLQLKSYSGTTIELLIIMSRTTLVIQ